MSKIAESKKIKTFEANEETYKIFKSLIVRDGKGIGDTFNEFMENYIRIYGDGNATSTLDQFVNNEEMIVTPAFFDSIEKWTRYIESPQITDEIRQKAIWQCQTIGSRMQKMKDHGMTSVRYH